MPVKCDLRCHFTLAEAQEKESVYKNYSRYAALRAIVMKPSVLERPFNELSRGTYFSFLNWAVDPEIQIYLTEF